MATFSRAKVKRFNEGNADIPGVGAYDVAKEKKQSSIPFCSTKERGAACTSMLKDPDSCETDFKPSHDECLLLKAVLEKEIAKLRQDLDRINGEKVQIEKQNVALNKQKDRHAVETKHMTISVQRLEEKITSTGKECIVLKDNLVCAEKERDIFKKDNGKLNAANVDLRDQNKKLTQSVSRLEGKIVSTEKGCIGLKENLTCAEKERDALKKDNGKLNTTNVELRDQNKKLTQSVARLDGKIVSTETECNGLKDNLTYTEKERDILKKSNGKLNAANVELHDQNKKLTQSVARLEEKVTSTGKECNGWKENLACAERERDVLKNDNEKLNATNVELCDRNEKLAESVDRLEEKITSTGKECDGWKESLACSETERDVLRKDNERLDETNAELLDQNDKLTQSVDSLEKKVVSVEEECVQLINRHSQDLVEAVKKREEEETKWKEGVEKERAHLRQELTQVEDERDEMIKENKKLNAMNLELGDENEKLTQSVERLEERIVSIEKAYNGWKENLACAEMERDALRKDNERLDATNAELRDQNDELTQSVDRLGKKVASVEEECVQLINRHSQDLIEAETKRREEETKWKEEMDVVEKDRDHVRQELTQVEDERDEMIEDDKKLNATNMELADENEKLTQSVEGLEGRIVSIEKECNGWKENLACAETERDALRKDNERLDATNAELQDQNDELTQSVDRLEKKVVSIEEECVKLINRHSQDLVEAGKKREEEETKWKEEMADVEKERDHVRQELTQVEDERDEMIEENKKLSAANLELSDENEKLTQSFERLEEKLLSVEEECMQLINRHSQDLVELGKKREEEETKWNEAIAGVEKDRDHVRQELTQVKDERDEMIEGNKTLNAMNMELTEKIEKLNKSVFRLKEECEEYEMKVEGYQEQLIDADKDNEELNAMVSEMSEQIQVMEEEKEEILADVNDDWKEKYLELELRMAPFKEVLDNYELEKKLLLEKDKYTNDQLEKLTKECIKNMGHQNHKQKIKYLHRLKEENLDLSKKIQDLHEQSQRQEITMRKQRERLEKMDKAEGTRKPWYRQPLKEENR